MDDERLESSWIIERTFLRWLMKNPNVFTHAQAIALLMIFTRVNNRTGIAYPGKERISTDSWVGTQVVSAAISLAVDKGLLIKERRGQGKTNVYWPGRELRNFHAHESIPDRWDSHSSENPDRWDSHPSRPVEIRTTERAKKNELSISTMLPFDEEEILSLTKGEEDSAPGPPKVKASTIISAFNSMAEEHGIAQISGIAGKRRVSVEARINQYGIEKFLKVILSPAESEFLRGEASWSDRKWKASFDWLIIEGNFLKVLEGKYMDRKENGPEKIHHAL